MQPKLVLVQIFWGNAIKWGGAMAGEGECSPPWPSHRTTVGLGLCLKLQLLNQIHLNDLSYFDDDQVYNI